MGLTALLVAGIVLAPLFESRGFQGLSRFLYGFYRLGCHQIPSRSWFLSGQKLGVCVRCFSIYLFLISAGALFFISKFRNWLAERSFLKFVLPLFLILLSPLVIDGSIQLISSWESTNLLRFITGGLAGTGTIVILGYAVQRFAQKLEASIK